MARSPPRPASRKPIDQFVEAGWPTLTGPEEYGGQGLPQVVGTAVTEYILSANHSFEMYQGLTVGRDRLAAGQGLGRAQAELRPNHDHRQMDRDDEPHRAALRHRPRPSQDPRRAQSRRQLCDHRHQDLHLVGRARPCREHHPPGPRQDRRRAGQRQRHLLFVVPKFLVNDDGSPRRAQRALLRRAREEDGHPRQRDLRHELRRREGLAGRRAREGPGGDVHHDERGAARRRAPGPRPGRGRLPECGRLREGSPPGPRAAARTSARPAPRPIRSSSTPTSGAC